MSAPGRWLPLAAVTLLAAAFAFLNRGEVVPVSIGIATFYRAPLVVVVFAAFLLGMLAMLVLGLRQDLRTRRILREHGLIDTPPEAPSYPTSPPRYDEHDAAL
ncbi:MAG TPA: LapA family protein [Longimicrobium sp.]|nr:LapA family protein [Longimicrobium sp.]